MRRFVVQVFATAVLVSSADGCLLLAPDTCSDGLTMSSPRLANGIEGPDDAPFLRLQWDLGTKSGAELPHAYFEHASVEEPATEEQIASTVEATGERELTIHLRPATEWRRSLGSYEIDLRFPSRVDFTGCVNPPHDDSYTVTIEVQLDSAGRLVKATFGEQKHLQPI